MPKTPHYTNASITATLKYGYDALARGLGDLPGKKLLDYGSGTGRSAKFLHDLGAYIAGTDIRQDMIDLSQKQYPQIEFKLMADNKIPWPDQSFDIVISAFVHIEISSLKEFEKMHQEIKRVLKPEGQYFILTVNPNSWGNQYESFSSQLPADFSSQSGQKIKVQMQTEKGIVGFEDYYWQEKDYVQTLESAGFKLEYLQKIRAEKEPPPFWLIKAEEI